MRKNAPESEPKTPKPEVATESNPVAKPTKAEKAKAKEELNKLLRGDPTPGAGW